MRGLKVDAFKSFHHLFTIKIIEFRNFHHCVNLKKMILIAFIA